MSDTQTPTGKSTVDALDSVREALVGSAERPARFGSLWVEEDRRFLKSVDQLLEELGVQFAARNISSAVEIKAIRLGIERFVSDNLATSNGSPDGGWEVGHGCDHAAHMHNDSGCTWEKDVQGDTDDCGCDKTTAYTRSQSRWALTDDIARETGDFVPDPDDFV